MALAIDASTPAIATQTDGTVATVTTASFTPPNTSLLVVRWSANSQAGTGPAQPTITDNLGVHLTYTLRDWQSRADAATNDGQAAIWTAPITTGGAMTVTVTNQANSGNRAAALHVTVITGHDTTTSTGAHGKSGSNASSIAQSYTAQATGGWGFICTCDWDLLGAQTAGTGCTLTNGGSANVGTAITYGFLRRTSADDTNGGSNTLNVTLPGSSTNLNWAYIEILPDAATSIPWNPQRSTQTRDYGEAQWLQRPRRDTALVAAAANDLASPLFTPADGAYWHLYSDSALRSGRIVGQQREYFDPSLLTPAATAVTPSPTRTIATRDYGEAQWLQSPRRDPSLLTTALLENELLGGADTAKRYQTPATHASRRTVPQQPIRDSEPTMLSTALLENELLGGADLQRRYFAPATHASRRLAPQQRPYISEPSTYPVAGATDPLTLAWGAGGSYWHLYNDVRVERRVVPQQPLRDSLPGLLDTAQLDELLGSGDTARHYLIAVTHASRRLLPAQRQYFDQSPPTTDPLALGNGDAVRRFNTPATHAGRRLVPRQPARATVYTDDGPLLAPLLFAWGAGGHYWHLYNAATELYARVWSPQQRHWPVVFSLAIGPGTPIVSRTPELVIVSQTSNGPATSSTVHAVLTTQTGDDVIVSQTDGGVL